MWQSSGLTNDWGGIDKVKNIAKEVVVEGTYAVNNPILHIDPDGKCPPWICGAIAGALVEAGSQYISNLAKGQSWGDAARNIDGADVVAAGLEGGVTGGGSVARRLLIKGGAMVASEVVQASVDAKFNGDIDVVGTKGSEKSAIQVVKETAIGVGSNLTGEGAGGALKAVTNTKHTKQLAQVNKELGRSMKGSNGEAVRLTQKADLTSTIKGNKVVAESTGTVTSEVLDNKLKNDQN